LSLFVCDANEYPAEFKAPSSCLPVRRRGPLQMPAPAMPFMVVGLHDRNGQETLSIACPSCPLSNTGVVTSESVPQHRSPAVFFPAITKLPPSAEVLDHERTFWEIPVVKVVASPGAPGISRIWHRCGRGSAVSGRPTPGDRRPCWRSTRGNRSRRPLRRFRRSGGPTGPRRCPAGPVAVELRDRDRRQHGDDGHTISSFESAYKPRSFVDRP